MTPELAVLYPLALLLTVIALLCIDGYIPDFARSEEKRDRTDSREK